jgi:hypothetical protein
VIELQMVRRMTLRGLAVAPLLVGALWLWRGSLYGVSGAAGLIMTLANLWLAAHIIGRVAESSPHLLLPAALASFALGLLVLTGAGYVLQASDVVSFPVTGFTLIGSHLGLVLWEASSAYRRADPLPRGAARSGGALKSRS